jgi:hypothetical protein
MQMIMKMSTNYNKRDGKDMQTGTSNNIELEQQFSVLAIGQIKGGCLLFNVEEQNR